MKTINPIIIPFLFLATFFWLNNTPLTNAALSPNKVEKYYIIHDVSRNLEEDGQGDIIRIVKVKDARPLNANELRNSKVIVVELSDEEIGNLVTHDSDGQVIRKIDIIKLVDKQNNEEITKTTFIDLVSKSVADVTP